MPLNIPAGWLEISFIHGVGETGHQAVCTIGAEYTGSTGSLDDEQLVAAWGTLVVPLMTANTGLIATKFAAQGGTIYESSQFFPGQVNAAPASPQVAYLIKKITGLPGRKQRGRMYLPGVDETVVNGNGGLDTTKRVAINSALALFKTAAESFDFALALLHNGADAPTHLTGMSCDTRVATQRRRLR